METTLNQEVKREIKAQNKHNETRVSPNVVAAAKAAAKADIKAEAIPVEITSTAKPETKPVKVRQESNEALGERLLKEKADEDRIIKEFAAVYKSKAGVTDKKFVVARAAIYMNIAKKRQEAKAATKKAS